MRVAILLIPDSGGDPDVVARLEGLADDAGGTLHLAGGPEEAIARIAEIAPDVPLNGSAHGVERARQRATFLARAGALLVSSLDYQTTLSSITSLVVPELADWCAVDMLRPDGNVERLAVAHVDPEKVQWAHELHRRIPRDPSRPSGVAEVLRTGRSAFYPVIPDESLVAYARNEEELAILREIGLKSAMIVPILVAGRVPVGVVTFVFAESGRLYTEDDLTMAEELARRSAMAIENARLYDEVRQGRELLQVTLASIGDAVATTDLDGRVTFMNGVAEAMSGWSLAEASGRSLDDVLRIVDAASGERLTSPAARVLEHGGHVALSEEAMLVGRDGQRTPIEQSAAPIRDGDGRIRGIVMVFRDIAERRRAEFELRAHGERLEVLNVVGRALTAELDLRTLVQTVTDAATRLSGAAYGAFFFNASDDGPRRATLDALSGLPRDAFRNDRLPRPSELFAAPFGADAPIVAADVSAHDGAITPGPFVGLHDDYLPVRSYLAVPVVARSGELLGGLFFGHPAPGVFGDRDRRTVEGLAAQAAIAMDNARLYSEAQLEIAERRRAQEEMMRARDEAEAANRAKDQFLAVLSHELRTPLTPVLAVTHVLENDDRVAPDQRPLIEMIRRNVELEARLIDDLLDLTRISKGKLSLNFETIDLHRLINGVVSICRTDLSHKQLVVMVDLQARDHFVRADSARIQQVLWNLIKNAIKFTPEGGRITVRTTNDRPGHIRIEVVDSGIGIDPEILPRIFNAFDQGAVDITRQYGGLGLGLSISRSLVEMHGGMLTASSGGRDRGSTFAVELDTVVRARIESSAAIGDGVRRAVRVLIVDDHIETSKVMKLLLERRGYVVHAAHTLHDALEATRTSDFDLLISDIGLPDGSGLDLMRSLSDRPICGIALSGFGMDEDIARSREAGFAEHLIKPVSFQSLQETIGRVLG